MDSKSRAAEPDAQPDGREPGLSAAASVGGNAYLRAGSRAAALHARASRFMPGGNTRASVFTPPHPPYAARGRGCRILDVDGTERIDFHNNYTALILGHADPRVIAAVGE